MKIRNFGSLIVAPLSLSVFLCNCGDEEQDPASPKTPVELGSQPIIIPPPVDPNKKEVDDFIDLVDDSIQDLLIIEGELNTSIDLVSLRVRVDAIKLVPNLKIKDNLKVKSKLSEGLTRIAQVINKIDAKEEEVEKSQLKVDFMNLAQLNIGKLQKIKVKINTVISSAILTDLAKKASDLKKEASNLELNINYKIKGDVDIEAKKQEVSNLIAEVLGLIDAAVLGREAGLTQGEKDKLAKELAEQAAKIEEENKEIEKACGVIEKKRKEIKDKILAILTLDQVDTLSKEINSSFKGDVGDAEKVKTANKDAAEELRNDLKIVREALEKKELEKKEKEIEEEEQKLNVIEQEFDKKISSAVSVEDLNQIALDITPRLSSVNEVDDTVKQSKKTLSIKFKSLVTKAKNKIKEAKEKAFETKNKANADAKVILEDSLKENKTKLNVLTAYVNSNNLTFNTATIVLKIKQIQNKLDSFKKADNENAAVENKAICDAANGYLVELNTDLGLMNDFVEKDKVEKAKKNEEAEKIMKGVGAIFPSGTKEAKDKFLEEATKGIKKTEIDNTKTVLRQILTTSENVKLYEALKGSKDFKDAISGGNRGKVKNIFENVVLNTALSSVLNGTPLKGFADINDLFKAFFKKKEKDLATMNQL